MLIRDANARDEGTLWRMLTYAASMPSAEDNVATAKADPALAFYVAGFGEHPGDSGLVASVDGVECGAAWLRLLRGHTLPGKVATESEPELAIGVDPEFRGRGVGANLLEALVDVAQNVYPAIVLSVREENPSIRLYRRFGFVTIERIVNRVGGTSLSMRLPLER